MLVRLNSLLEVLGRNLFSCLLQLLQAAYICRLWTLHPSSTAGCILVTQHYGPCLLSSSSTSKNTCDYIGPIKIIQAHLLSWLAPLIPSIILIELCQVIHRFWRLGYGLPTTMCNHLSVYVPSYFFIKIAYIHTYKL